MSKLGVLKSLMKEVQAASKAAAAPEELARPLTAAERAAAGKAATEAIAKQPVTKMSEALGNVGAEGKKLRVTQADRTAAKYLGGPPFSGLQLVDPRYAEARATWGVKTPGAAKNIANQSDADVMWSTLIGSPFQHKSNEIVFDKLYKAFQKSAKEGNLSEELRAKFNAALEPHFGEGADILDPKLRKEIDTFDKRRIVGSLLLGEQLGGALRGGSIIPGGRIMMETAEPMLRDVETFSIGPRLFTLDKGVITRPDLHPAFPEILQGEDLGQLFTPVPNEIALPTFHEEFRRRTGRKKPGYYDLTMTPPGEPYPTQEITDKYLRHLQKEGFAEGGVAMADGGQTFPLQRPELVTEVSSRKPKHPLAELLGKGVGAVHEFASKPFGYENPPGEMASSLLGLPAVATTLERFAYGEPLTSGSGETLGLRPETTEALMTTLPVAGEAARLGAKGAKALAPTARDVLEAGLERAAESTRMYAVPPGKPGKVKAPANPVGFYNPAEKAALNLQRKQGPGSAFISDMKKLEQGVNDERIAELGLDQLASRPNVTRDEVVALAEQNRIPLKETVRRPQREVDELDDFENTEISLEDSIKYYQGGIKQVQAELDRVLATAPDSPLVGQYQEKIRAMQRAIEDKQDKLMNAKPAKFGPDMDESYSLPGGEDYREIRVRLPSKRPSIKNMSRDEYNAAIEKADREGISDFMHQTHHDDEPNVLFHLRVANHVDEEGKRGLLIDELQSDWHQKGRDKGYGRQPSTFMLVNPKTSGAVGNFATKEEAEKFLKTSPRAEEFAQGKFFVFENKGKVVVPDAPFKDNWYQLGLKRAIKEAVDTGMDRVYLTTGARQADRYDLSKHIDRIDYNKNPDGSYNLSAIKNGTEVLAKEELTLAEVEQLVGKDMAKKMTAGEGKSNVPADRWEPEDSEIPQYKTLSGLDLKVGGEGMRQYYDKTYKNFLDKYAKQHGGKLGMTKLEIGKDQNTWPAFRDWFAAKYPPGSARGGSGTALYQWEEGANNKFVKEFTQGLQKKYEPVYYIDLTDAMRNSAKKGQSYKAGGAITMAEGGAVDYESRFNEMLQKHLGMAEGGAVDYESRFNEMLQKHIGMAEGGSVDENPYNSDPDMSDGGLFVPAPAFKKGGAVKSIWKVN